MDEQRCFASAAVVGNKIFVVGGTGNYFLPLSNCELYDPVTDMWSLLQAELNVPRSNAAVGKAKKKIFVFGGTYSNIMMAIKKSGRKSAGYLPQRTLISLVPHGFLRDFSSR